MGQSLNTLSEDEVVQITSLVESLDRSSFDFLQIEVGELKVTIGKGAPPAAGSAGPSVAAAQPVMAMTQPVVAAAAVPASSGAAAASAAPVAHAAHAAQAAPAAQPQQRASTSAGASADATVAIAAPMMGRYYARPEPGAAPFVQVGDTVNADTTVGLIEVMKVFTAVPAGVSGVVTEICVQDAEFVEFGQALFRVRPA